MAETSRFRRNEGMVIRFFTPEGSHQPRQIGTYNQDPGKYYYPDGEQVSDELARAAGFDVEGDTVHAEALIELRAAEKKLEEQLAEVRAAASGRTPVDPAIKQIDGDLRESPNFKMDYNQSTRLWDIYDTDGNVFQEGLDKVEASKILHEDVFSG